ncbi:DNA-methyltransferase [Amycolatopsis japonica]|uniref:DNA-methyltransferase n=1 Tax=Amycolatopsis japonica TaxID=208439 RepID=UPI0033E3B281
MTTQPTGGGATSQLPRNTILVGDARQHLTELPTGSIDTIITSPPYFGVRDYGHDQQLGAERDVDAWADALRGVAAELARVLRPSGTLWLNLGDSYSRHPDEGATPKSLLLGPARVALALVRDGWTLRNEVIWAKPNPMPSSVLDRLTTTHEVFYLFTRSRHYYFNLDAIRGRLVTPRRKEKQVTDRSYPPRSAGATSRPGRTLNDNRGLSQIKVSGLAGHPLGKNPGDVWMVATTGFRGGHFATFPLALVERPLLATCPERICTVCGTPWQRSLERRDGRLLAVGEQQPACMCDAEYRPGIVLDPFLGTGTTALAAQRHGRDWLGIELNPKYVEIANERLGRQPERHNEPSIA